jgi:hypothetical protein
MFRDNLSVPYSRIRQSKKTTWPLKMGPIGYPETSVRNCHSALPKITEERRFQHDDHLCLNFKCLICNSYPTSAINGKVFPVHAMKACRVKIQFHSFLTSVVHTLVVPQKCCQQNLR